MKTLIIEDEGAARRRLEGMVQRHEELEYAGYAASGHQSIEMISNNHLDLLLMDIQLKDMTAFEVLKSIKKDFSGRIIFITAYHHFAVRAFEVYAIDYLLKPYTEERLYRAIDRCLRNRKDQEPEVYAILESLHSPNKICIPEGKNSHLFDKDEIEWIKADGYHCQLHLIHGEHRLIRILLKDLDQLLPNNFLRISRSLIINKSYIRTFNEKSKMTYFQLESGKELEGKKEYLL